jgi:hypothetical protein
VDIFAVSSEVMKYCIVRNRIIVNMVQNVIPYFEFHKKTEFTLNMQDSISDRNIRSLHELTVSVGYTKPPREGCWGGEGLMSHFLMNCSSQLLVQPLCIILFQHGRGITFYLFVLQIFIYI